MSKDFPALGPHENYLLGDIETSRLMGAQDIGPINPANIRFPNDDIYESQHNVHEKTRIIYDRIPDITYDPYLPPMPFAIPIHRRVPSNPPLYPQPLLPQLVSVPHTRIMQPFTIPHSRQQSMPMRKTPSLIATSDSQFQEICNDPDVKFNPVTLGFIPARYWPNQDFTFGSLVRDFFQKKNNANSRFSHKLYNALKISSVDHFYAEYIGIEWITDVILKVDKNVFARLLGIKTIDGSLFHQQGNFPSHGFVEIAAKDARMLLPSDMIEDVDYENVRLLIHQPAIFVRNCTEEALERCKWIPSKRR